MLKRKLSGSAKAACVPESSNPSAPPNATNTPPDARPWTATNSPTRSTTAHVRVTALPQLPRLQPEARQAVTVLPAPMAENVTAGLATACSTGPAPAGSTTATLATRCRAASRSGTSRLACALAPPPHRLSRRPHRFAVRWLARGCGIRSAALMGSRTATRARQGIAVRTLLSAAPAT